MTGIYPDNTLGSVPGRAKSTLTVFFDFRSAAEAAVGRLEKASVDDVRLMPSGENPASAAADSGFWSRLGDWFLPDEDRDTYAEGVRRGGFLVSASVDQNTYGTAHAILDDEGSTSFNVFKDFRPHPNAPANSSNEMIASSAKTRNDLLDPVSEKLV